MKPTIIAELAPFSRAIHNRFGFVSAVYVTNPISLAVRMFMVRTDEYYDYIRQVRVASAGSLRCNLSDCVGPSLGEAFERYSLSVTPRKSHSVEKRVEEVSGDSRFLSLEDIQDIQGLHPIQYNSIYNPLERIGQSTKLTWSKGRRMYDNSEIWIPNELTVLKINKYFQVTTNGCAIQKNEVLATLKASYELMERDSFLKMWWRKEKPIFLDYKETLKQKDMSLYRSFGPWIDLVHVGYIPNDFQIPVLFGVFRSSNKNGHPALMVSGGAHLNPEKALISLMNEMASSINHKMALYKEDEIRKYKELFNYDKTINDFHTHTYYYMFDDFAQRAHFVEQIDHLEPLKNISDLKNLETDDPVSDLESIKESFKKASFNPIILDMTSDEVRKLGFSVIRVLDSKTIDLNASHILRPWGKKRLFCDKIKNIADLNQLPHPFP